MHHQHHVLTTLDLGKQHFIANEVHVLRTGALRRVAADQRRIGDGDDGKAFVAEGVVEVFVDWDVDGWGWAGVVVAAWDEDDGWFGHGC